MTGSGGAETGNAPPCEERAWSELPQDILRIISKKLPDLLDFVRFRAICTQWRSAPSISDSPQQLFWWVENPDSPGRISFCTNCFPADSPGPIMDLPELPGMVIDVSLHGYIISVDANLSSLSLLNPFNGREITLPTIDVSTCKILYVGTYPIENREYVVISKKISNSHSLSFCKIGDPNWKSLELEEYGSVHAFHNEMFFVQHSMTRATEVTDVTTGALQFVIPPPPEYLTRAMRFMKFVVSCGNLLGIMLGRTSRSPCNTFNTLLIFEIYELEWGNENPRWVKKNNIGDQFLLMRPIYEGLSLKASDFPGFQPNCIYFLIRGVADRPSIVRYEIETEFREELFFPHEIFSFFLPSFV